MKCTNCNSEHNSKFCPNCGTPAPDYEANAIPVSNTVAETVQYVNQSKKKKKKKSILKRWWFWLLILIVIAIAIFSGGNSSEQPQIDESEKLSITQIYDEIIKQEVKIISTKYLVQDDEHKTLYPDMLSAIIRNDSTKDIKNAIVAFVAWDENNLPVKIIGDIDFSEGSYVRNVSYNDINLIPGATFGDNSGFEIDETCNIHSFKAIVVSYETFEGETWNNPFYDRWKELLAGVKLDSEMETAGANMNSYTPPVTDPANTETTTQNTTAASGVSITEIENNIAAQEVKVISTKYMIQDDEHKALYPDMLQAVISNGGSHEIKNAVVAFVAWDKNNLPVKIKGNIDFSDGSYIKQVAYNDINLIPGTKYGENSGFEIDENCNIHTFKAILVSYESFDGYTWENPCYYDWCSAYEGIKLSAN